jgi:chromosome partitioning protein
MLVVTVANRKGGVAKTTTVVNLAHGLALRGEQVWIVDVDPQGQSALALGVAREPGVYNLLVNESPIVEVLRPTGRPRLSIVPGDGRTTRCEVLMTAEGWGVDILARAIRAVGGDRAPDFVIVDTPPSPGGLQTIGLWAADLVIVPCKVDYLSTDGVAQAITAMSDLRGRGWSGELFGVLPTFYDERTLESKATLADLLKTIGGDQVLDLVHSATVLTQCVASGKTIWEWSPRSRAAEEYERLVQVLLQEVSGGA